jgi:hypothetical protein
VVVVEVLAGAVVGAAATGGTVVVGPVLDAVVAGSDAADGVSGASAGSIAIAWLHADARRQPLINKVIRVERTMDNLQIVDRRRHVFRGCSPTTHSARRGSKP